MKVGFIGLGAMGRPMAKRLRSANVDLMVFDVMDSAVAEMVGLGATAAKNPAELAAEVDIVCSSLPNSMILKDVMIGVLTGIKPGALAIDLSTVEPHVSRFLAERFQTKDATFIDAPVSGGVVGAEAGTLTIMVGASETALAAAEPVLRHIGKKITRVGEVGSGQAMKLVNNMLLGANMAAVAEALTLGAKLGLTPKAMLETISQSSGRSYALEAKAEAFIFHGKFEGGFAVELQYKDLELAISTAKSISVPLPMATQAQMMFEIAKAKGRGREDISSVIKFYEDLADVKVRS